MSDTPLAEAAVDATLNVVDEVTRLTVELATLKADRERLAQSVAEAVREWCAVKAGTCCYRRVLELDVTDVVARVLGGGR